MTDAIHTFFDGWGETDADKRHAALAAAVADDVVYIDPRTPEPVTDLAALATYVGMFSANAPGWTAKVVQLDEKLGYARVIVAFGGMGPDGKEMIQHGTYFAQMQADRITKLVGFAGAGAPE